MKRRTVSVTKEHYATLQAYAYERNYSCSELVEHAIGALVAGALPLPPPKKPPEPEPVPRMLPALTPSQIANRQYDAQQRALGLRGGDR